MEVTSCVQSVVNAATVYTSNPSDTNQVHLQRQLDVLISLTSRSSSLNIFCTREMLPTECLSVLVDIIDNQITKPSLAQKIMLLFDNLAVKEEIRHALHCTFHLTSSLAKLLKTQTISAADPNTVLCLKLLHKTTYACKVSFHETYLEDLMIFLTKQIQDKEDELTLPCVGLLANLCRNNIPVQMVVKKQENVKIFYKKLGSLLSHKNNRMVIFALSALASLCLNESFGEKVFSSKNINQIFQLLFNILMKADIGMTRRYTVDVFIDLLKHSKIKDALSVYDYLDHCLADVLVLLGEGQGDDVSKIFELLLSLCSVNGIRCVLCRHLLDHIPPPDNASNKSRQIQTSTFHSIIQRTHQTSDTPSDVPLLALDFLKEVYEEILDQALVSAVATKTEMMLTVCMEILTNLDIPEGLSGRNQVVKIIKTLQLLQVLTYDECLTPMVAAVLSADICNKVIEEQLNNNPVGLKGVRWIPSSDPNNWSEDGVGVLLYTIDLMITLKHLVPNMETHLCAHLQDPRLVSFLSQGLTSGIRDRVHMVLKVISHGSRLPQFPVNVLGDRVAAQISQQHSHAKSMSEDLVHINSKHPFTEKENFSNNLDTQLNPPAAPKNERTDLETSVESIIDKMQSGFKLKDARASEIISIYEHRLQSLTTKETHLQDLLEAKAMAMAQADRLITQYRCRMARTEAEAQKLRSLLQDWEKRSEDYREQINEMMLEREKLSNDMDQVSLDNARLEAIAQEHRELGEIHTQQTQRLENTQRSLSTLKQEHQSLSDMHDMLKRHNDTLKQQYDVASHQLTELEDERKNQSKQLKEKEVKAQEMSKNLNKAERDLRKMSKERDDLEIAIDKMREELAKTETVKKELQHQVSSLELVCHKHEATLKEKDVCLNVKDALIKEQKQKIDKHNEIAQLIHNITGSKPSS